MDRIFLLGNAKLLTVDGHQLEGKVKVRVRGLGGVRGLNTYLEGKVGDSIVFFILKHQGQGVSIIFGLLRDNVVVASAFEDLGQVAEVDADRLGPVASEVIESFSLELEMDEAHFSRIYWHISDGCERGLHDWLRSHKRFLTMACVHRLHCDPSSRNVPVHLMGGDVRGLAMQPLVTTRSPHCKAP